MKIGFFTDPHYSSQDVTCGNRYNNKSLVKIKEAYAFFEKEQCDLIICLGDLTDSDVSHEKEIENMKEIAAVIHSCPIKTMCVMGNHDAFAFTVEEFYEVLGGCRPEDIHEEDKTLLFIDSCYFDNGRHYTPEDSVCDSTFYPHMDELERKLSNSRGDIYLLLHQVLDLDIHRGYRVHNAEEITALLERTPAVKTVFEGHYHKGYESVHNGIRYKTFAGMCEKEQAYFIEEI